MNGSRGAAPMSSRALWVEVLDIEPRVTSIWPEARGPRDCAVVEDADIVLPRASVVAGSHCLGSAVFGRNGGLVTLGPE